MGKQHKTSTVDFQEIAISKFDKVNRENKGKNNNKVLTLQEQIEAADKAMEEQAKKKREDLKKKEYLENHKFTQLSPEFLRRY